MHNQSERERYSHRKCTTVTKAEEINSIITKKIYLVILAAMDSCFGLVRPRQHGITNT